VVEAVEVVCGLCHNDIIKVLVSWQLFFYNHASQTAYQLG
jgi:hypothetical protein